jgi:hypothetical protein
MVNNSLQGAVRHWGHRGDIKKIAQKKAALTNTLHMKDITHLRCRQLEILT